MYIQYNSYRNLSENEKNLIDQKVRINRQEFRRIFIKNRCQVTKGFLFGLFLFSLYSAINFAPAYAEKTEPGGSKLVSFKQDPIVKTGKRLWLKRIWANTGDSVYFWIGFSMSCALLVMISNYFDKKIADLPFYVPNEKDIREWLNKTIVPRNPWGF
jgi:hypothetical protein